MTKWMRVLVQLEPVEFLDLFSYDLVPPETLVYYTTRFSVKEPHGPFTLTTHPDSKKLSVKNLQGVLVELEKLTNVNFWRIHHAGIPTAAHRGDADG